MEQVQHYQTNEVVQLHETIFLDKSALTAFMNPSDLNYEKARTYFLQLDDLGRSFSTSNFIIFEVHRWLRNEFDYAQAEAFLSIMDEACEANRLHLISVTSNMEQDARKLIQNCPELKLSLDEAVTAILILSSPIKRIFSFNPSFISLPELDSRIKTIPSPGS